MNTQPKPSEIVIMVSGLVALIAGFMTWFSLSDVGGDDLSAFGEGLFPLATYVPLIGLAMGVLVALTKFANVQLPDNVAGFTWTQLYLVASIFAGLIMIGYLIMDKGAADMGIGLWLGLLAAIGLIVGSVMLHMEGETATDAPSGAPPTPF